MDAAGAETHAWQAPPPKLARGVLAVAAAAIGVATLLVVPRSSLGFTTYAGVSPAAEIADAAAGLGLLAAGLLVWILRPGSAAALLVSLAGVTWFAPAWVGWETGPPFVRSVAMLIEPFFLAFIVHLVLAVPGGRLGSRAARCAVGAFYVAGALVAGGLALFRDPFYDASCWNNCTVNVLLISNQPLIARVLGGVWTLASIAAGFLLALVAVRRLRPATPAARRLLSPMLLPASLIGVASIAHAVVLVRQPVEDPRDPIFAALFHSRAWAATALAVGVALVAVQARRTRGALAELAAELAAAPAPGSLGPALARATHDPSLEVVYPRAGTRGYVDPAGRAIAPPGDGERRTVTPIVRGDEEIALVVHDRATVDADQLRRELGPAARLAVENERLQAQLLAELDALRSSRARVVEAGDDERRRLERNLHDGAQQQLLALVFDLGRARTREEADGDGELLALLSEARNEALQAVDDLRELAHGIYPAVLTEAGLGPAVATLTDRAPFPVEVHVESPERLPDVVERTAYIIAADVIDAAQASRSPLSLRVRRDGDLLIVEAEGAGPGPFVNVEDRVGALGGSVTVDGRSLRAELPCA